MAVESLVAGTISILFAIALARWVLKQPAGTKGMLAISDAIREGSNAYLKRQYSVVSVFAVILAAILAYMINYATAAGFLVGAILSALAGFIGMNVSVRANVRTANAAKKGLNEALKVAYRGGAVTGFFVVGLGLLGVASLYLYFGDVRSIIGFGFGASLISLFARIGGGIYTKAADVGADLVGKIEKGIPEDDLRNPAVIADNVGDNVGDCAGMAADLFETYVVTLIAAMLLGSAIFVDSANGVTIPLLISAAAIYASIIGSFFVNIFNVKNIMNALYRGLFVSAALALLAFYYILVIVIGNFPLFLSSVVGIAVTLALFFITDYFTSKRFSPVQTIAKASETGPGTNVIAGLAIGLKSTFAPLLILMIGIFFAYINSGIYGIVIAAVSMLSLTGIIVSIDAYGPITDNAGGIAEMSKMPRNTRKITDALDAVGNTTKAVTKGFAIGSAVLAALALFSAFAGDVETITGASAISFNIMNPFVLIGLFIGAGMPFLFSAFLMEAVGKAAFDVVKEVRRQFKTIKGIMQYKAKPDYGRAVDIVTKAAQRELLVPGIIAVFSPLAVGLLLGYLGLAGFLAGSIVSGFLLAVQMTTGGAAWDNAKKYIEDGAYGGKGSPTHKAAIVGDTVGDPFKDTAGPAINPLIKVFNIIALLFLTFIINNAILV